MNNIMKGNEKERKRKGNPNDKMEITFLFLPLRLDFGIEWSRWFCVKKMQMRTGNEREGRERVLLPRVLLARRCRVGTVLAYRYTISFVLAYRKNRKIVLVPKDQLYIFKFQSMR
jgi:hypothetical protein